MEGNEGTGFTRPLGATPQESSQPPIALHRDQPALPGIDPGERKRRPSPDRQRAGEKLRGDVRVRIFDITAKPGTVRVVLTGNRSGISVEQESSGNTMLVIFTILRLWLRGASKLGK